MNPLKSTEQVIPAQSGTAFILKKNQFLKVIDPEGSQVSDLFCFNLHDHDESLSSGRSIDYNDTIYMTKGMDLYSNRSQVMLRLLEDTCGRHDFLYTPCSLKMFQIVAGNRDHHPSCHENLATNFAHFGLSPDRISTTFNIFMNVSMQPDGRLQILPPLSKANDYVLFEAQMDLLVGLTACSEEATNDFKFKPIRYQISNP